MGTAIDTVVFTATNPGSGGAAATANTGDSLTVRNFPNTAFARLDGLVRQGATEGFIEVKSPRMHDAVRGLHYISAETPTVFLLPRNTGQPVFPADTLTVNLSGGTAEVDAGAWFAYYSDVTGIDTLVASWEAISGMVKNLTAIEVDVSAQATSGAWSDTVLTTTQNLLKANTYYALLGYITDTAALAIGLKGPETGNLRLCGPGPTSSFPTHDYFIRMSDMHKAAYIPIFNANNRGNLFCSTALVSTSATPKIELICAELDKSFTP